MAQQTALYRLFGADNQLLYVGITEHLGTRWSNHMKTKEWWSKVRRQTCEWYDAREAAAAAEKIAIQEERPRFNIAHAVKVEQEKVRLPKFLVLTLEVGRPSVPAAMLAVNVDGASASARDLLHDIDAVLGDERVRLSKLPVLLRALAPTWEPYEKITGREIWRALRSLGIRVTNTNNILRLDPKDLRAGRLAA